MQQAVRSNVCGGAVPTPLSCGLTAPTEASHGGRAGLCSKRGAKVANKPIVLAPLLIYVNGAWA